MWANLLSAIGKGAKKGIGAIDDLADEGDGDTGLMTTPPFMPERTFPGGTAPWGSRPATEPPRQVAPLSPPTPPPASMAPEMDHSGVGVPIPSLPGRSGGPQPYSPIAKAKYEHVMKGADSPAGGFKRSFKDIALNAALGGLQGGASGGLGGAVGGAIVGGAGTAINPMMGREYQFETLQRPGMEREEERGRTSRRQRIEDAILQAKVDKIPRDAEMDQAKLEQIRVGSQVAIDNAKRQQAETDSRIQLNEAKAEAARTGRPQKVDRVNPQTKEVETVMVYPNGDEWIVGASGAAAMQGKKITSQEKIATERNQSSERRTATQQAGATGRTAMAQTGANTRQAERLAAQGQRGQGQSKLRPPSTGGGATPEQIQRIISESKKRGRTVTEEQVRARLKARGQ